MSADNEFVSVDPEEVLQVLLTHALEFLHLAGTKVVVPLARGSIRAVVPQEVQADVEFGAGAGVFARAVQPVAFVVVKTDLKEREEI